MVRTGFRAHWKFTIFLLLVGSVVLVGCGQVDINEPGWHDERVEEEIPAKRQGNVVKRVPRKASPLLAKNSKNCLGTKKTKKIKYATGGKIKHCGHEVYFPPNALSQDATASISILQTSTIDVDFGPNGAFNVPVEVTLSYADADLTGIDEDDLTVSWYDEETGQWNDIGGVVDKKKQTITALANHFTQYTLSVK